MKLRSCVLISFFLLVFSFIAVCDRPAHAQGAENTAGDLWGDNLGDQILLLWSYDTGAHEYVIFKSTSQSGPWSELFRADNTRRGAFVDITPDASKMTLCYKVEAYDQSPQLIRLYDPMCVPQYVP